MDGWTCESVVLSRTHVIDLDAHDDDDADDEEDGGATIFLRDARTLSLPQSAETTNDSLLGQ